jgi:large conductance mechanosensitive channel
MKGFIEFIRSQGVIGMGVGFIMGSSITKLTTSLVTDIINPFIGLLMGSHIGDLKAAYFQIGSSKIFWGSFASSLVDFLIIAFVVYLIVKLLGVVQPSQKKAKKK